MALILEAAYLASVVATRELITGTVGLPPPIAATHVSELGPSIDRLRLALSDTECRVMDGLTLESILDSAEPRPDAPSELTRKSMQGTISHALNHKSFTALYKDILTTRGPARAAAFLSCGGDSGGLWLLANPAFRNHRIPDKAFSNGLRRRLSVAFYAEPSPCRLCGEESDIFGGHARKCNRTNLRNKTHTALVSSLVQGANALLSEAPGHPWTAHREVWVAPRWFQTRPNTPRTRADGAIDSTNPRHRARLFDITVTDAALKSQPVGAANHRGAAAEARHKKKMELYAARLIIEPKDIHPIVFEANGFFGAGTTKLLAWLAQQAHSKYDATLTKTVLLQPAHARAVNTLATTLAVDIVNGNSECIEKWRSACHGPKDPDDRDDAGAPPTQKRARVAAAAPAAPAPTSTPTRAAALPVPYSCLARAASNPLPFSTSRGPR